MTSFKQIVVELHRRSVWQVLGVYVAASWGVIEAVDLLTEQVGLPDWTPTMALVLLLLGLPLVLATAIVQEGIPSASGTDASDSRPDAPDPTADASGSAPPQRASASPDSLPDASPGAASDEGVSSPRRLFTWRNALLGGVGAFTLLGLSVAGYFVMWTTGVGPVGNLVAQGVFEEGESVVLADFDDATDAELGDVVTEAIRVDLSESPVLHLMSPAYVAQGLARMGLPPDSPFTASTARELAVRDGLKAFIAGEVSPVGSGYLLTASVVAAESGEVLKAFRVSVGSEDELLRGIDKLSQDIREKSGESLRSIRAGPGLEEATTASLDALRLYTDAVNAFNQGRQLEAVPLLEEALDLDPEFAMAWRKLAVVLSNHGLEPDRAREASRRAWELRRRLTEREAGLAEAWYHSTVEDNPEAAIDAYHRVLERHPDDPTALNNIAVRYQELGRWAEAEAPLRRSVIGGSPSATNYLNFVQVLWNLGRPDEARTWQDSMARAFPDAPLTRAVRSWILAGEGRWGEAHALVESLTRDAPPGAAPRFLTLADLAGHDLARGRHREAMEHLASARSEAREAGAFVPFYQAPGFVEFFQALSLQGPAEARRTLEGIETEFPVDSLGPRNIVRATVAHMRALAGDVEGARRLFGNWEAAFAPEERGRQLRFQREGHRAVVAWGEGRWNEAVAAFDRMHTELRPCAPRCLFTPEHAVALDEAGRSEEALQAYRWSLDHGLLSWYQYRTMWHAPVLERMGRLHEARGEAAEAAAVYRELVERFGEGDGPFVGFVERARARLTALEG